MPWLTDRKWAYIRMEGTSFGDVPLNVELKLEVWDSPNSAGIVIDAVRLAKLALNNGVAGALEAPSSYLMKSPPKQIRDDEARENTERFIKQHTRTPAKVDARRPERPVIRRGRPSKEASAPELTSRAMRICLVTPFSWSQPHEVNDHVAGVAAELRKLGHSVTVLAPSSRAADLRAGRRSLADGADADVIALGPAVPISRRSQHGRPRRRRART